MRQLTLTIILALLQTQAWIDGVVRDANTNTPLAGVKIELQNPARNSATTDAEGRFSIQTTGTGRFQVVTTREGYVNTEASTWVQVSTGETLRGVDMKMSRQATISGRLLYSTGEPVVGNVAGINLMRYGYSTDGTRMLLSVNSGSPPTRTNDKGEFRFYDLLPGQYYLTASGGGRPIGAGNVYTYYYPGGSDEAKAVPIEVKAGENVQLGTLTLPPQVKGTEVKLRVVGPNIPTSGGWRVQLGSSSLYMTAVQNQSEVRISNVAPGHFDVVASNNSSISDLLYVRLTLDVGNTPLEQDIEFKRGLKLTGKVLMENEAGERLEASRMIGCRLYSTYSPYPNCDRGQVVPGEHRLEIDRLPPDAYVLSAKIGDRDVLTQGADIQTDSSIEVVIKAMGAIAQGVVRDSTGAPLRGAVVVLIPDEPYRKTFLRYRDVVTDTQGKYEIHGIAPGSYKLYAWPELPGAAYRNPEFMKPFEDRGKTVKFEKTERVTTDLSALQ